MSQDNITLAVVTGTIADGLTGWVSWLPEQTLQNVVYELTALWLVIQIVNKLYQWYKGSKSKNED